MECGNLSEIIRFFEKTICILQKVWYIICHNADLWCNGSTSDSGSLCRGSNPCRSAIFFVFFTAMFVSNPCKKQILTSANKVCPSGFFLFARCFSLRQKQDYSRSGGCLARLDLRSAMLTHVGALRLRRILAGLSFFCGKRAASRCRTAPLSQFDRFAPSGVFLFARCFSLRQKQDYSLSGGCLALLDLRSAMLTHVGALRLRRILAGLPFFCGKRAASRCRTAPLSQFDRFARQDFFFLRVVFSSSLLSFFM